MNTRLRQIVPHEEFDYQVLLDGLRDYAHPRDRATRLRARGAIIRVKKGLYVFGRELRRGPFSREVLANLISGPSYVSLASALSFHGLIPERVEETMSATVGKRRSFSTPAGRFTYWPVPAHVFSIGVQRVETPDGRAFLIASPEKALCDTLIRARGIPARSTSAMAVTLRDDFRIDPDALASLDSAVIADLARRWPSRRLSLIADVLGRATRGAVSPGRSEAGSVNE